VRQLGTLGWCRMINPLRLDRTITRLLLTIRRKSSRTIKYKLLRISMPTFGIKLCTLQSEDGLSWFAVETLTAKIG